MKFINNLVLRDSLSLLPRETPKKLILLVIVQVCISTLDIIAIVLIGVTSKIGLDYIQNKIVKLPEFLTNTLGINNYKFDIQVGVVFGLIVMLFSVRTIVSVYSTNRIVLYLANQAGFASKRIMERTFSSKPHSIISKNSQETLYGITNGIDNLTLNYLGSLTILISELFFLVTMFFVVIAIQPITGLMAFFIFAFASFKINKITSARARIYASDISKLSILYNRKLLESLLIYRELFLRSKENAVTNEVQFARSKSLVLRAQLLMLPTLSKYLFELTLVLGGAAIALVQVVLSDSFKAISSVMIFLAAASRILPSLIRAQSALITIRQSEGGSEVIIKQIRELERDERDIARSFISNRDDTRFIPRIKVNNLSFSYRDESDFALEGVDFEVSEGQFIAIVGESGAGKTTLIDLLLGILTPKSGIVEISNEIPLNAIQKWPGKIAYVPQDIMIIDGDIRTNIVLEESNENVDEDVLSALEKSHLKDDVLKMKDGLSEIVGERGTRISGGQRQRLGIARALYTKPEIIFFDEATSSLDPLTEKTVTEAIYGKKGNVTLIVVAHRLSTVKNADLVLLMDKGKVVAKGTFEEVRNISPKFDQQAKLVNL